MQAERVMKQTTRNQVSITKQAQFFISLPPIAEQQRIEEKLNQLLLICEHLKSRIIESSQLKQKLADALVEQAVSAT